MANGLELRSPYTDHRLIQYVFNLPWEWKCGPQKNLFTELRKAFLPKDAPKPEGARNPARPARSTVPFSNSGSPTFCRTACSPFKSCSLRKPSSNFWPGRCRQIR